MYTEYKDEYRNYINSCKARKEEVMKEREELQKRVQELMNEKAYLNSQIGLSFRAWAMQNGKE